MEHILVIMVLFGGLDHRVSTVTVHVMSMKMDA